MSRDITFGSVCSDIEAASKPCSKCKESKPLEQFHRSAKARDGRASWCKSCGNSITRIGRKRTYSAENKRRWQLKTRYKLTPEAVDKLRAKQGGTCALCPEPLEKFHVDHDHNTGAVRGLLCHRCNIRLGGWDDIDWRARALQYLNIKHGEEIE